MPLITESVGRVLGKRYRLLSAVGAGASAQVFLAEDVSLRRHVAVKVLQPGLADDEAFLKRFRAEARLVASLNHPHLLRVFDWGEEAGEPYLVLEYLGGGSLLDIYERGTRLSPSQASQLGAHVARGLAYAHPRGLVHRDIKPANLLFDEEGRVRVADFGVARALAEAAWTEPAGSLVGTARYASPEQAQGSTLDGRADVYSLALVLYEGLTGEVPFVSDTTMGTLMARVGRAPAAQPRPRTPPGDPVVGGQPPARRPAPGGRPGHPPGGGGPGARHAPAAAARLPRAGHRARDRRRPHRGGARHGAAGRRSRAATPTAPAPWRQGGSARATRSSTSRPWPAPMRSPRSKSHLGRWIAAFVVLLAALGGGLFAAAKEKIFIPNQTVPPLSGLTVAAAQKAVAPDKFTLVGQPRLLHERLGGAHHQPAPERSVRGEGGQLGRRSSCPRARRPSPCPRCST